MEKRTENNGRMDRRNALGQTIAQMKAERLRNGEVKMVDIDYSTFKKSLSERNTLSISKKTQKFSSKEAREAILHQIIRSPQPKWGSIKISVS